MKKTISVLFLTISVILGIFSGCGSDALSANAASDVDAAVEESAIAETPQEEAESSDDSSMSDDPSMEIEAEAEEIPETIKGEYVANAAELPIADGVTFSCFVEFPGYMSMFNVGSFDDLEVWQYAVEQTGVSLDFTSVSGEAYSASFRLMAASGDFTDLIVGGSGQYTSTSSMIEDGMAIDLMGYLDYLPNYWDTLNYYEDYIPIAINQEGQMAEVIKMGNGYVTDYGLQIRADWLEKLGMDVPTTYDDIHEVLTAFKTEFGADHALLLLGSTQITVQKASLSGGYGTCGYYDTAMNMFVKDGVVENGFVANGYKEYLEMLSQWYAEGLIANDFASESNDPLTSNSDAYIQGGNAGIWNAKSDNMDANIAGGQTMDKDYSICAMPEPVLEEGETFHFGDLTADAASNGIAISECCEDIETACAFLDFWFSAEGQVLANYGIEGVSFEYDENGDPQFTDAVLNSDIFPMVSFAVTYYTPSFITTLQDYDSMFPAYSDENIAAMELWTATEDNEYVLPNGVELTAEESAEYNAIWGDLSTYADTEVLKFAMGVYSFDSDWDGFITQLYDFGLQTCIDLYQAAYDRYVESYAS